MAKISVGLDIGYNTIKVVALERSNPPKLVSLGMISAPSPGIASDGDLELEQVASAIKKLMAAAKINEKQVVGALPESKLFSRVIDDLPYLSDNELPSTIKYASEEFIPMPIADVELNWQVLARSSEKPGKTVVFVVATPKNLVSKYIKVIRMAGLNLTALETDLIALTRAIAGNNPFSPTSLIIQLGAATTDFAVVSNGLILLTRSIATGGMALTRAIGTHFNFEVFQAEEYKKVYGLLSDQLEGQVYDALRGVVDVIVEETKRVIQAYASKNPQNPIKRVVLSGGGSKLPGIVIYLANNLGMEVQEADPWYFISKDKATKLKLVTEAPVYTVAVGLALREN